MRDIFLGNLSRLNLFDVLKTLLVEKKTGVLIFAGKETGEIYLNAGEIFHAKTGRLSGEEAFLTMTAWKYGKATFRTETVTHDRSITISSEQLLLRWSHRKGEWEEIREIIPSPSAVFRLCLQQNGKEKNIRADEWNVLALSNGMRDVSEIAEVMGWGEFQTSKMVCQLVGSGLLEKAEDARPSKRKTVGQNFFPKLETEFKRVMGPVGSLIVEDALIDFGETREFFPRDCAERFIETLGEEIAHEAKRRDFVKGMMDFLASEK